MSGELLFVLAVCVAIAVLVGLCVYEGLTPPRNRRLTDLDTIRQRRSVTRRLAAVGEGRLQPATPPRPTPTTIVDWQREGWA
jgi:hypothetical protein